MEKRIPNLLVIGAAKSGSTSLYKYLNDHPDIFMPGIKEPNFFSFPEGLPNYRGPKINNDGLKQALYLNSITNWEDYLGLFAKAGSQRILGEASVSYMYVEGAARRIKKSLPGVKIIAVLRNPVDRAHSKFRQFHRDGLEPIREFSKAIEAEQSRRNNHWSPTWYYIDRGYYYRQLKPYFDEFDHKRIKICLFEELRDQPAKLMEELYEFLEVDPQFTPSFKVYNSSHRRVRIRNKTLRNLAHKPNKFKRVMKRILGKDMTGYVVAGIDKFNEQSQKNPTTTLPFELRCKLTSVFREDIISLQKLIDRDLSHWLNPKYPD